MSAAMDRESCLSYISVLAAVLEPVLFAPLPDSRERIRLAQASLRRVLTADDAAVFLAEATVLRAIGGIVASPAGREFSNG